MSKYKKDGNQLRVLLAQHKTMNELTETYLRWCDECNTVYILTPEERIPVEMEIPLLEYQRLPQMEML